MAEQRRVAISTLPPTAPCQPPAPKKPRVDSQESDAPLAATVRIALSLFEPDQKKCPEFFYPELLRTRQKDPRRTPPAEIRKPVPLFDDEAAERKEVEDLARKMEEKYGNKKKKKDRMLDLIDMGYGYDESDSFIDNSEAYDELVPASLTTKYGGFYINSGTLQFRQASESEDEFVKEKKKKSPKVDPLSSLPSGSSVSLSLHKKIRERPDKLKKKKREEEKKGKRTKQPKPGFTALNGMKDKKKRKKPMDVSELLARFRQEKEAEKKKALLASPSAPLKMPSSSMSLSLPPPPPHEAELAPDPLLSTLLSDTDLLQAASAIESLSEKDLEKLLELPVEKPETVVVPAAEETFKKPPSLPDGLPTSLERRIKELTKAVRASEGEKKAILFTQDMNTALLDIYLLSRELSPAHRSAVFTHLSSVLPCSKDTLVKWASRLYLHKQGGRLREPLWKLKDAIAKVMPEQISKYNEEFKQHNEAKYAKMLADDKEQKNPSEEEEEEDKGSKKVAGPRKKFQWTEEIRLLLGQLVRMKMDMFEPEGSGGLLSLEDYFKTFLDAELKPLWPRGWMQARTLLNESRRAYPQLCTIMSKNKATAPSKGKLKESANKAEKMISASPMEVQTAAVSLPLPAKASSVPPSVIFSSSGSPMSTFSQDNSLDGDLIHNPPSLSAVSEHLNTLSTRTSSIAFDFQIPKTCGLEKSTEEKKKSTPVVVIATNPQPPPPSSRPSSFVEQSAMMVAEKKQPVQIHNSKTMSEVQQKLQQHGPVKMPQLGNTSLQPSVKLYQINNQIGKGGFTPPSQSSAPRVSASSLSLTPAPRVSAPSPSPTPAPRVSTPSPTQNTGSRVSTPSPNQNSSPRVSTPSPTQNTGSRVSLPSLNQNSVARVSAPSPTQNTSSRVSTPSPNQNSAPRVSAPSPSQNSGSRVSAPSLNQNSAPRVSVPSPSQSPALRVSAPSPSLSPAPRVSAPSPSLSPAPRVSAPSPSQNPAPRASAPSPSQSPAPRVSAPSPSLSPAPRVSAPSPPQRPPTPQTKSPKPATFSSPPSNMSNQKLVVSPGLLGKLSNSGTSISAQAYRSPLPRPSVSPPSNLGNAGVLNSATTVSQSPPSLLRSPSSLPAKKPSHPLQKLTLIAPQDSGKGTQGVAKLITSSMVGANRGNTGSPTSLTQSPKCSPSSGLISPSSAGLTVLTPPFKTNGGKIPPTSLGLMSGIHPFPLHVIYTSEAVQKAAASQDAIITGPAPGTFHHGLTRNLLSGLQHSTPISVPALSGHTQPPLTDAAHVKNPAPPPRKL
ncbi:ubinuclein-1 isoform X2 [Hyperolius riggenbachi]|uniref:ubinuclein-1 isoform X2 n=1 Tax=Hyperolius riggenbachi TaxID=752182 RepID=UPI0035A2896E